MNIVIKCEVTCFKEVGESKVIRSGRDTVVFAANSVNTAQAIEFISSAYGITRSAFYNQFDDQLQFDNYKIEKVFHIMYDDIDFEPPIANFDNATVICTYCRSIDAINIPDTTNTKIIYDKVIDPEDPNE